MSAAEDRKTIEELLVLYEIEPTIRDVFVEGSSDRAVVEWFLAEMHIEGVAVQEIDTVNVPHEDIQKLSLEDNNRGRVIALAFALQEAAVDLRSSVACIADTDLDSVLEKTYDCPLLIFTVFTSLELYLFDPIIVGKFLRLVITNFRRETEKILSAFAGVLTELFLIRVANQELAFGIRPLSLNKFVKIEGYRIDFDKAEYVIRYLNKGAQLREKDRFVRLIEEYRSKLQDDPMTHMHGHDFIDLLILYVTEIKRPRKAYQRDLFARSLFGVLEPRFVQNKPLFQELVKRFGVQAQVV